MRNVVTSLLLFFANTAFSQIGYQVSLLNSATGQPRAGETVTVDITLTDCENVEVYTTQQKVTSNDFGVLSLSVGDTQTFDELDWNKLPLYIEVSIDGVLIAKSQVLSVPVAEYAKKSGFVLTKELLISKEWSCSIGKNVFVFNYYEDGTYTYTYTFDGMSGSESGSYYINNNIVYAFPGGYDSVILHYIPSKKCLTFPERGVFY